MKLFFQSQLTFKGIKLNESERKRSDELLQNLTSSDSNSDAIKFQLYELYSKHLEKEVNLKTKSYHLKEDFAQEMFLKFFETLENIQKKITPIEQFISILDKVKPTKDELKSGIIDKSIENSYHDTDLALKNVLTEANLPQYASSKNDEEIDIIREKYNELIGDSCLNEIDNRILTERGKGKTFSNIGNKMGISASYSRVRYNVAVAKIQNKNGVLPEVFGNLAEDLKNTYKLKNDISEIKKVLINYLPFLSFNTQLLKSNIEKSANAFGISESEFVEAGFMNLLLFTSKSETLKEHIKKSASVLGISESEFIKFALKWPALFSFKSETLKSNVETSAKTFGVSEPEFIKAALIQPSIFYIKSETLKSNIENSANTIGISELEFIKAALKFPNLFILKNKTIKSNVENSASVLGISEPEFIKAALRNPSLFILKSETLKSNVENSANALGISEHEFIKAVLKCPALFTLKNETLKSNVENSANALGISEHEFVKAALRHLTLFSLKKETLMSNIENSANTLGISEPEFIKAALRNPSLFILKSETLKSNVENSANALGISESEFIKAALKSPSLFLLKAETIKYNIERLSKLINADKSDVINLALIYSTIFVLTPETSAKKINVISYSKQIKNKKTDKLTFTTNSIELIFKDIISYFLKQHYSNNQITPKNFIEYIKSNPNEKYIFKLPQSRYNDEFIEFTKNFFKTHIGKSNVNFVIANCKRILNK